MSHPAPDDRPTDDETRYDMPRGDSVGTTASAYLLAGPLVYGGLGWFGDHWLSTRFLTPLGVLGGMVLALYVVWLRYGRT